jgi:hypothetical protein
VSGNGKKKKSEEWDIREKEWNEEMSRQNAAGEEKLRKASVEVKRKKINPKTRFKLMLVCLGVLLGSIAILWLTMFDANAYLQATISMFSAIISGIIFLMNYGKDIAVSLLNALTKSSLR